LAATPNAVWVAQGGVGSITRVDTQYNRPSENPIAVTSRSGDGAIVFGKGSGSLWAVFGDSTLVRIDPASGTLERGYANLNPSGIVYAEDAVWVANGGVNTVERFAPDTFTSGPVARPITVGLQPTSIAYGEGTLWVTNGGDGTVDRIDPTSNSLVARIDVGERPVAVTVGGGAAWVANAGDGTVARIDQQTNHVETIHTGNYPAGVAVSGGFVWVTAQKP